jgi:hypothetical protein
MAVMSGKEAEKVLLAKLEKLKEETLELFKDSPVPSREVLIKQIDKDIRKARRAKKKREQAMRSLAAEMRRGIRLVNEHKAAETQARVERRKMREV